MVKSLGYSKNEYLFIIYPWFLSTGIYLYEFGLRIIKSSDGSYDAEVGVQFDDQVKQKYILIY